jgi:hypothetical protein
MRSASKALAVVGILGGIVGAGVLLGWFAGRGPAPKPDAPADSARMEQTVAPRVVVDRTQTPLTQRVEAPPVTNRATTQLAAPRTETVAAAQTTVTNDWEDQVDEILQSDAEEPAQARKLLKLFPRLPEEGQVEVAQHLANLTADEDYAPLRKILTDPKTAEDVSDILLSDLLDRPNAVKLPSLLEIARNPQHAKAEEAKDLLELYLDENYGDDWRQWQQKMEQWLKENPD